MNADYGKRLNWLLTALTTLLLFAGLAAMTMRVQTVFRPLVEPELERHAETVGQYVIAQVDRALELGIPMTDMVGVDELLGDALTANPDISYLAITDGSGKVIHYSGPAEVRTAAPFAAVVAKGDDRALVMDEAYANSALPLGHGDAVAGVLHVGMRADYVEDALTDVIFDLGSILVVAALFNVEILIFAIGTAFTAPLRQVADAIRRVASGDLAVKVAVRGRDEIGRLAEAANRVIARARRDFDRTGAMLGLDGGGALGNVPEAASAAPAASARSVIALRFAVFVFSLAEELTRTFLSVYIKDLFQPVPWLTTEVVIGAPIGLFMFLWAIAQPIAGGVSERRGRRRIFLVGATLSALGLIGSGLATDLVQLIVARCVTAVGYASVFISAQGMVIDNTDPRDRAQAMALYAGGILTAGVCGPAIGGVIADQVGFRVTFLISGGLAVLAALLIGSLIHEQAQPAGVTGRRMRLRDIGLLLRNPRFLGVALFSAVPTKLGLTALMFFLLPLYLDEQGVGQAAIGRMLLLYWLLMIVVSPIAAKASDRFGQRQGFLILGGIFAAGAAVLVSIQASIWPVVAGIMLLGVGHAMVMAPQLALLSEVCADERRTLGETTVIGVFRLIERFGSVVAPLLAGLFLAHYGYTGAIQGVGVVLAACVLLFALLLVVFRARPIVTPQQGGPA